MTVQEQVRAESPVHPDAFLPDAFLDVRDMVVEYPLAGGAKVHAVSGVSFQVAKGETLGLVG
ncbi:MAG: hypothetical protein VX463_02980, partial [Pseudomonadota bacterium]|nr:hypothetical protein [Pseudomonadota bacterium]